jgi:mono/diheme cytochrome c family protein
MNTRLSLTCVSFLLLVAAGIGGCRRSEVAFSPNTVFNGRLAIEVGEPLPEAGSEEIEQALADLFGSPDAPALPASEHQGILSAERLQQAAGPVYSDENDSHFGLYRKHCVRCHGITGDGRGPAAKMLNPYPRDFRLGKFKYKSTPIGTKPTREDLARTLIQGIPGTSMPSFHLLREQEIESLVDYVIYLSVRGETERELLRSLAFDFDYEDPAMLQSQMLETEALDSQTLDSQTLHTAKVESQAHEPKPAAARLVSADSQIRLAAQRIASQNLSKWSVAPPLAPSLPTAFPLLRTAAELDETSRMQLAESINRGEELFRGNSASCAKCHGEDARGGVGFRDYDDWTKDWTLAIGLNPEDRQAIAPLLKLGALKPVAIPARNLQYGGYRGGGRPEDLYYRIVHGIEGTPMPALPLKTDSSDGLNSDQVWDIVNYLYSFSSQSPISQEPAQIEQPAAGGGR